VKILRLALSTALLAIVGIGGVIIGILIGAISLGDYSPNMLLELITSETPQAKISAYLDAIKAQDRDAALAAWHSLGSGTDRADQMNDRRNKVTDELLSHHITNYMIFHPEWWRTCCEPGVTDLPRNAGGARIRVQVMDDRNNAWQYTFDVFAEDGAYFGDAAGNPYRHWQLRDVYPHGEAPIYWDLIYTGVGSEAWLLRRLA